MPTNPSSSESRIRELEEALRHTREIADAERRRADALEKATRRAYRMAIGGRAGAPAADD